MGCPFDCVFCNQKKITGKMKETEIKQENIERTIEEYLSTMKNRDKATIEVAFFGGSFTGIEKNIQKIYLRAAKKYKDKGDIQGIRLSTRPDYIDSDILSLLKEMGVTTIELGVQSLDEDVLIKSGRGHNAEVVGESSALIKEFGFSLGLQMMIGLPGHTRENAIETAKKLIELEPEVVRIYPTLVIKDTELEELYKENKYIPLGLEESVDICADIYKLFLKTDINVIRIGLQPTENLMDGSDLIAGPFHSSYRALVEEKIFLDKMEKFLSHTSIKSATLHVRPDQVSFLVGNKRNNMTILKEKYDFTPKSIKKDDILKPYEILVETDSESISVT
jgi:histone acetyltransferase (RNA polymerase elongator complex component)